MVFLAIRHRLGGRFGYTLDDPYIHLALAENLVHGHYGINPTEFSSPSSSILWPMLLMPCAGTPFHVYVPLVWNLLFGSIAAFLIGGTLRGRPAQPDRSGSLSPSRQLLTAVLLIFAGNLVGLTFVGMEHLLQVLLAICCALGMMEALDGRPVPRWCLAAAVLAPMVRYEDLALTLAVCCALAGLRQWKTAAAVLALSLAPLLGFAAFLRHLGLPMLPMSVLVKGHAYAGGALAARLLQQLRAILLEAVSNLEYFAVLALFVFFVTQARSASTRPQRFVYLGAALLGGLQLLIGRFGWFYRYEAYAVIFLALLFVRVLSDKPHLRFSRLIVLLVLCAEPYVEAAALSPAVAGEVYTQQYQMHRFVTDFYHGDYAVNDLGLTSFQRTPGAYVLDVYGLASYEASRQPDKSAVWLQGVVARHNVPLAMLYPEWFHIPPAWTAVARMCQPAKTTIMGARCVVFYSTTPQAEPSIRADLHRFAPTLPAQVHFTFDPPLPNYTGQK
jgi:hypothetical protein